LCNNDTVGEFPVSRLAIFRSAVFVAAYIYVDFFAGDLPNFQYLVSKQKNGPFFHSGKFTLKSQPPIKTHSNLIYDSLHLKTVFISIPKVCKKIAKVAQKCAKGYQPCIKSGAAGLPYYRDGVFNQLPGR